MEIEETILAYGHKKVQATHKTTLEVTKERHLSDKGDCIVSVSANRALTELGSEFKENLCKDHAKLTVSIEAGEITEIINAFGSSQLILTHPADIVVRKSHYVCSRTIAIRADKAACDLQKELVNKLRDGKQMVRFAFTVKV